MTPHNEYFDIVGSGYVAEHHAENNQHYLLQTEKKAVGGATAWLAFYATAVVITVIGNFSKTTDIVLATAN